MADIVLNGEKPIEQATRDMDDGHIEKIRIEALHEVVVAKSDESRVEDSARASLAKDIAIETLMPGAKIVTAAMDLFMERRADSAAMGGAASGAKTDAKNTMTIEDNIRGASRAPGVYRDPPGAAKAADPMAGVGIFERAQIAFSTMRDQKPDHYSSRECTPARKDFDQAMALKQRLYTRRYDQVLDSVAVAKQHRDVQKYMAAQHQMAPGMNMTFAPRNAQSLMSETAPSAQDDSWTGSAGV